ncbi:MAG: sugar ABC transporter permease [Micrococcales bacterium]|nr:sugar ABC transporter permease [Micrococcales bacterium]
MTTVDTPMAARPVINKPRRSLWWRSVGWRHIVGLIAVVYALFPLVIIVNIALSPGASLAASKSLFSSVTLGNFGRLFSDPNSHFPRWVGNTMIVGTFTAIGTVLMGAAASYAFSRFRFRGRRGTLSFLLVVQMFPQLLSFVAIFLLLTWIKPVFPGLGMDSLTALICVYLGGALGVNTFLMYGFFNTVPQSIDEAARIDGATHTQIFWTIILRLVAPILAVVALLSFISSFSEYVIAKLVLTTDRNWTLAVSLYTLVSDPKEPHWDLFAAGAIISAVPVLLLFLFLQRYIVSGLTSGAVKG